MNNSTPQARGDVAPGDELRPADVPAAIRGYLVGLALAALLTCVSFYIARSCCFNRVDSFTTA